MGYKFKGAVRKYKGKITAAIILWIVLTIVFICPLSLAVKDSFHPGSEWDSASFFTTFGTNIVNPFSAFVKCFYAEYIGAFFNCFKWYTIIYGFFIAIGFIKAIPKSEYEDIEHGSSDWSINGEQYKILSPDKGIILAQKNYLPVDKRGNVNVLVVGGSGSRKICIICYTKCISMFRFICIYRPQRRIIR